MIQAMNFQIMSIFDCLVIGHLIADWLLQTKDHAVHKTKGNFLNQALLTHSLLYTLAFVPIFLIVKIRFGWLLLLFFSHLFLDRRWPIFLWLEKVGGLTKEETKEKEFLVIMTDQIFHILILTTIVIFS